MVAYSFKQRFVAPILAGTKRQTVRGARKRHARPGEAVQIYTGMRTKHCRLIGRATCLDVLPITFMFSNGEGSQDDLILCAGLDHLGDLDAFARADGFANWAELCAFWRKNHPGVDEFHGVLIRWGDLERAE